MYRKAEKVLKNWKDSKRKRALLVSGARQIGKTYLVREFGTKHYKNFVEINFITTPSAKNIFSGDLDVDTIIMNLTAFLGRSLERAETLIFLDEIQECPQARTAIKFLVEDGRFDYIESGSLLGVNYKVVPSYPVGYEESFNMYPMDFEEFCVANGIQEETFSYLKKCYDTKTKVSESVHKTMMELFRCYIIVGGMPAVVQTFIDSHDIGRVTTIQKDIVLQYRQDISKYSLDSKTKITNVFDKIPSELEAKNKRFQLASIDTNARMREYEDAFMWLKDAGVGLPCYNLNEPKLPLKINEKTRLFKLFMNDSGLLCSMGMENIGFDVLSGNISINMGGILENTFACQLKSNGFNLRYLNKKNVGELDFVVQYKNQVIPIEIKSGKNYRSHPALNNVLLHEDWNIQQGLVFCTDNINEEDKICYLPWYMIMFFKEDTLLNQKINLNIDI